jgi:ATP phosphoribosyltransferase regulatory subunit HisZ
MVKADRIEELEEQIAALKRQWPAHSVPPSLLQRLDDLEDELEMVQKKVAEDKVDA